MAVNCWRSWTRWLTSSRTSHDRQGVGSVACCGRIPEMALPAWSIARANRSIHSLSSMIRHPPPGDLLFLEQLRNHSLTCDLRVHRAEASMVTVFVPGPWLWSWIFVDGHVEVEVYQSKRHLWRRGPGRDLVLVRRGPVSRSCMSHSSATSRPNPQ